MMNFKTIFILSSLLVSVSVQAQTSLQSSGLSPEVQKKITATTFRMEAPEAWCTVSSVTPDGYLLTALHCVRECLLKSGAAEEGVAGSFGLQDLFISTRRSNVNVVCPEQSIPALGVKGVTVVATGRSLSYFGADFFNDFSPFYEELAIRGWASRGNDFALLKVEPKKKLACLPILPQVVKGGVAIWGLGYPEPLNENETPTLQSSHGRIFSDVSESSFFKAAAPSEHAYLKALYNDSAVLYSNAFSRSGQSGGPIVNAKGAILGVISGYSSTETENGEPIHELVGARSSSIATQLPGAVIQASSQCR